MQVPLDRGADDPDESNTSPELLSRLPRRSLLASVLGLGVLNIAGATAAAQSDNGHAKGSPPFYNWQQDVNANGNGLLELGELEMADNSAVITDFAGENLSIDTNGVLNAVTDSRWRDINADGLLEIPESDGINVGTVDADEVKTGTIETSDNPNPITDFAGENLSISENGVLNADVSIEEGDSIRELPEGDVQFAWEAEAGEPPKTETISLNDSGNVVYDTELSTWIADLVDQQLFIPNSSLFELRVFTTSNIIGGELRELPPGSVQINWEGEAALTDGVSLEDSSDVVYDTELSTWIADLDDQQLFIPSSRVNEIRVFEG